MKLALIVSLSLLLLFAAGCAPMISSLPATQLTGSGKLITQNFTFDKADRLLAASNFKVTLKPGDKVAVKVTADDNVMEHLYVHVSNGELRLEMKPGRDYNMNKITQRAEVTMPAPGTITLQDNATAAADGLQVGELALRISGNGIATGDGVSIARLNLTGDENGQAKLSGAAAELTLDGRGNAVASCPELAVHTANVVLRDNGMATLQVTDKLDYNVSGNAGLVYTGNPQVGQQKRSENATATHK